MSNLKFKQFYNLLNDFTQKNNLNKNAKWLEIGCGNGNLIKYLNLKGKNCIGIDVEFKPGSNLKSLIAKNKIKLINNDGKSRLDTNQNSFKYIFPFESESLDFCFSSSVIEHVFDLDKFAYENSRVLKKNCYCLHYFASRSSLIEAHTGIPFGGLFINKNYYKIMCKLGLYNKKFRNFLTINEYMKNSTKYRSKKQIIKIFKKYDLHYIQDRNDLIIKHMGPKFSNKLHKLFLVNKLFGIFRSKLIVFKKL